MNVQKVYLYGIMINNSETEIQEDFLEWWNLVFLFGYYENRGRKELRHYWSFSWFVIRTGNNVCTFVGRRKISSLREYHRTGTIYIKGKFSFRIPRFYCSDDSQSVVIAFEISSREKGDERRDKREDGWNSKACEGSVENRDRVGNSNGEKK